MQLLSSSRKAPRPCDAPYRYAPLPTHTSIRLLQIQTRLFKPNKYSLQTVDLASAPRPKWEVITHSRLNDHFKSRHSIICDNRTLNICADTKNALDEIVTAHFKSLGRTTTYYVWMHTICVDMLNRRERGIQVGLFPTIINWAQRVFVWLGKMDFSTNDAIRAFKTLTGIPAWEWQSLVSLDWNSQCRFLDRLDLDPIPLRSWLAVISFFNKSWFSEIWSLQEITLAKEVLFVCGKKQMDIDSISWSLAFLMHLKWHRMLDTNKLRSRPFIKGMKPGRLSKQYQELLDSDLHITREVILLERSRLIIRRRECVVTLSALISQFRNFNYPDKRDMIFAMLGLASRQAPPFTNYPGSIFPDYVTPVERVYTNAARVLLCCQGISMLSQVQAVHASMPFLPSWVPDYSIGDRNPAELSTRGDKIFAASGRLVGGEAEFDAETTSLHVTGIKVDTVRKDFPNLWRRAGGGYWAAIDKVLENLDSPTYPLPINGEIQTAREAAWRTTITGACKGQYPAAPDTIQFLLDPQDRTRLISPEEFAAFEAEIMASNVMRVIFTTEKGYLGLGPISLRSNDEVWIIADSKVPFVLRKKTDGSYRFIGEAYVHGVMHGEVLKWSGVELKDIALT